MASASRGRRAKTIPSLCHGLADMVRVCVRTRCVLPDLPQVAVMWSCASPIRWLVHSCTKRLRGWTGDDSFGKAEASR